MVNRNKELAINTVILGFGQLIPKMITLLILPILTTYLTKDENGTYDLILSFANLMIPLLTLQIQQAVFRYLLAALEGKNKSEYVTTALSYVLASSVIVLPIIFVTLYLFRVVTPFVALLICFLFFAEAMYNLLGQIVRGLGFNLKYSISVIVFASANLVALLVLVVFLGYGFYGVLISLTLGYLSADAYMMFASGMVRYISLQALSKEKLKQLLAFSAPIVPSSIALWIVNLSDRLIIIRYLGLAANGVYAIANKIPTLYNTAYSVFNLAWTETASRVSDDGNPAEYYSVLFQKLFRFLIGAMLIMIAITPMVFHVLVKGDYDAAMYQVPILYFGAFFNSFVNFYSGIYIALKRTKQVGISSGLGAILNVIINLSMVNRFGLFAASISTAVSFAVIVLYRAYDLNKVIRIRYYFGDIALGMVLFLISSGLLFYGKLWCIVLCFVLAIGYNYVKNLELVSSLFGKVWSMMQKKFHR